jgi:hypothetical protein
MRKHFVRVDFRKFALFLFLTSTTGAVADPRLVEKYAVVKELVKKELGKTTGATETQRPRTGETVSLNNCGTYADWLDSKITRKNQILIC